MFVKRRPWQRDANDQSERPGQNGDELPWAIRMPKKAKAVSRARLGSVDSWSLVLFSAAKNSAHLPAHRPQSRQLLPLLPPPPQFPALTQSLLSRVPCSSLLVPRPTRCLRPLTYHLVHFPSIPTNFCISTLPDRLALHSQTAAVPSSLFLLSSHTPSPRLQSSIIQSSAPKIPLQPPCTPALFHSPSLVR